MKLETTKKSAVEESEGAQEVTSVPNGTNALLQLEDLITKMPVWKAVAGFLGPGDTARVFLAYGQHLPVQTHGAILEDLENGVCPKHAVRCH